MMVPTTKVQFLEGRSRVVITPLWSLYREERGRESISTEGHTGYVRDKRIIPTVKPSLIHI